MVVVRRLDIGLLVASHARRARRGEESSPSLLSATVTAIVRTETTSNAEESVGQEETRNSRPHKRKSLDAKLRGLAVLTEGRTTLHEDGAIYRISNVGYASSVTVFIRALTSSK